VTTGTAQSLPEGPARIGQTVRVDGPTVKPIAIIEDSRCPAGVQCVWAGRVILKAEIGTGRGKQVMDLTLGTPVQVADGALTLRDVTPDKRHDKPIAPDDYRFTFEFAGGL
jgi:hypothetical protein